MKAVRLSCGHWCWVGWLLATIGRQVICPGTSEDGGPSSCIGTPRQIVEVE